VLEIEVKVDGSGSEIAQPGAGLKSRGWSVSNKARYRIALQAQAPIVNGERAAGASPGSNAQDDADWEKKWEAKAAACKGDPQCEMQVAIAQASDPHTTQQMKELSAMAAAAQTAPGAAPNAQIWDATSRTGPVSIHVEDNAFGVVSESGGGTVDMRCTTALEQQLNALPPNPTGTLPPVLTIDAGRSTYTLHLPLEDGFQTVRECNNGRDKPSRSPGGTTSLIGGSPVGGGSWSTILTVNGPVTVQNGAMAFSGRKAATATVLGSATRTATVTINWQFTAPVR